MSGALPASRGALHLVTDERVPFDRLCDIVDVAAGAGADVVQLRAKSVTARELLRQAVALSEVVDRRSLLVIDDRVDVALAARDAGARIDGVHLGQSDLPPETARRLLGTHAVIGWTANTPAHLAAASALPPRTIDYLGVGVIRPTFTKPDHPPVLGIDGFAALAAAAPLPCIAIGGVIDFVNIGIGPVRTGIFNVADVAILTGVAMVLWEVLRNSYTSDVSTIRN